MSHASTSSTGSTSSTLSTIYDDTGYRLDVRIRRTPRIGSTVEILSTWPSANHPEPLTLVSLTLPPASLAQLGQLLIDESRQPIRTGAFGEPADCDTTSPANQGA